MTASNNEVYSGPIAKSRDLTRGLEGLCLSRTGESRPSPQEQPQILVKRPRPETELPLQIQASMAAASPKATFILRVHKLAHLQALQSSDIHCACERTLVSTGKRTLWRGHPDYSLYCQENTSLVNCLDAFGRVQHCFCSGLWSVQENRCWDFEVVIDSRREIGLWPI